MADPNDPWAAFNPQAATGPVYGAPRLPSPQTPAQATAQDLSNVHAQQQIQAQPLQNANTQTNIAQGQQSLTLTPPKTAADFIKDFTADPSVKAYREVLPQVIAATQAGHNGPGDTSVVYGWAKAMDPTGSVREGDTQLAQASSGPMQRAEFLISQYHLRDGGTLPPEVRQGLIEEMRNKGRQLDLQYSQKYQQYQQLLKQAGIDPSILGPHEGDKYRAAEEQYVRSINGNRTGPTDPNFVALQGGGSQGGDVQFGPQHPGGYLPPGADKFPAELTQALQSGAIPPDPYAIMGWAQQHGNYTIPLEQARAAAEAMKKGVLPGVSDVQPYRPDITDVRGGQNTGTQDAFNAGVRGFGDTVSLGLLDKGVALGDTIAKGGTFDQNLARQYAISDYDSQNHPIARFAGQAGGGFLLPIGEVGSVGNLALKGAGYGAAYGAGSSRSLSDVPANALIGGTAGAAVPAAIGGVSKAVNALRGSAPKEIPPLVDPVTGELNQPMDAMPAGQRVQMMRDQGFQTVTPGMAGGRSARVIEQGLNNLPGSAGVMEDVNSAASGQARRAMQGVAQQFGSSKTLSEGGSELQRGARQYIDRAKALTSKAYDAIPISPQAKASTTATEATLTELTSRFASNPELQQQVGSKQLVGFLDAIKGKGLSWEDMKSLRSFIGEKIGERRFSDDATTGDLRAVYGALSEDMQNTAAAMGPRAQQAFNRANNLYREVQQRIDGSLVTLLGNDAAKNPERAAAAVQAMTRGGKSTGDLRKLAQIKASTVKSGAWDEIASTLIHLGGQPANSEGRAFNPATFVNWYADMSEPARAMLFKPELRKSLDQFVATSQQLSRLKGLSNTSNTTPTMIGSGLVAAGGVAAVSHPMALLPLVGGGIANNVMAKLWTSPKFVNLITGYGKAVASGNANAVKSQMGRLSKLATTNPELREGVEQLIRKLANDNAAPPVAASLGNNQQDPNQQ